MNLWNRYILSTDASLSCLQEDTWQCAGNFTKVGVNVYRKNKTKINEIKFLIESMFFSILV